MNPEEHIKNIIIAIKSNNYAKVGVLGIRWRGGKNKKYNGGKKIWIIIYGWDMESVFIVEKCSSCGCNINKIFSTKEKASEYMANESCRYFGYFTLRKMKVY